jgi:putative transposase
MIPPKISIAEFVGYLKGKSALMIYDKHPEQRSKWDKSFWSRGYYVATVGTVTEEVIKKYIMEQEEQSRKEDKSGSSI